MVAGCDAGVAKLATLSGDGTVFEPVNSFQKNREEAGETSATVKPQGQIQQQLAEQKRKIQRLRSIIANIRRDSFTKSQRPSAKTTQ
ncbi:transposase [Shigella flexneri]